MLPRWCYNTLNSTYLLYVIFYLPAVLPRIALPGRLLGLTLTLITTSQPEAHPQRRPGTAHAARRGWPAPPPARRTSNGEQGGKPSPIPVRWIRSRSARDAWLEANHSEQYRSPHRSSRERRPQATSFQLGFFFISRGEKISSFHNSKGGSPHRSSEDHMHKVGGEVRPISQPVLFPGTRPNQCVA